MNEVEWRDVVGFEGYYRVSNTGLVTTVGRYTINNLGYQFRPARIIKTVRQEKGYLAISLRAGGQRRQCRVHHLVLEAFIGPRPPGFDGCHNDGDPANNCIGNLRWDTKSNNNLDTVRHGNHPQASKTHCPKKHAYMVQNTIIENGRRRCRTCKRAHDHRCSLRRRGAATA